MRVGIDRNRNQHEIDAAEKCLENRNIWYTYKYVAGVLSLNRSKS